MRFNRLTRYSKILALVIFIAFLIIGFNLGIIYQKTISGGYGAVANTDKITVLSKYEDGYLKIFGVVQLPDSCHYSLKYNVNKLESTPPRIQIRAEVKEKPIDIGCDPGTFDRGFFRQVKTSEDTNVTVFLDGKKVE